MVSEPGLISPWSLVQSQPRPPRTLNIILSSFGIVAGLSGAFVFLPIALSISTILIATPWILKIVDNMLIEKWSEVTIIFLLIVAYLSICIWAIALCAEPSCNERFELSLIVIGAGITQFAWAFLISSQGHYEFKAQFSS